MPKSNSCESKYCTHISSNKITGFSSFITTVFIVLLPKCPLCIAAYSGAILLFFDMDISELSTAYIHVKPILGVIILFLILVNRKGKRTVYASVVALLALLLLVTLTYLDSNVISEWLIYVLFIFSIWLNGNLAYFIQFLRKGKSKMNF